MTNFGKILQPLIDAEQRSPGPPPEAVADCWNRIADDFQRGTLPALDVPPPSRVRNTALWLTLGLIGVGVLAAVVYSLRPTAAPPTVDNADPDPVPALLATDSPAPRMSASSLLVASPAAALVPEEPIIEPSPVPPVAKPRGRPAKAAVLIDEDTFAAELRLLAQGQAALSRGDHAEALRITDLYQKTYPNGHFTEDRDALRVVTLCASSARKASDTARRFLRSHPRSIHATRIREACDLPTDAL